MNIEQLIQEKRTKEIIDLFVDDNLSPWYEQLKDYPSITIRMRLAHRGYFLDHYIQDESELVREIIVCKDDNYIPHLIETGTYKNLQIAYERLERHKNPKIEHLKQLFNTNYLSENDKEAFKLCIHNKETKPDLIESTMTRTQLFLSDNPFWANGYTIEHIKSVLNGKPYQDEKEVIRKFALIDY